MSQLGRSVVPDVIFGVPEVARPRERQTKLRSFLRLHRDKLHIKFVSRLVLDKLLIQSGLIAQSGLMRAGYPFFGGGQQTDRMAEYGMAGRALCENMPPNQFTKELLVCTHFCVLLEKVPLKRSRSHAALFGNYHNTTKMQAQDGLPAHTLIHNEFPYDALNFVVAGGIARQTPGTGREGDGRGIFRNLQTVAPTRSFEWNKMQVRGICGFTGTFAPITVVGSRAHGLLPGKPLIINILCVGKKVTPIQHTRAPAKKNVWGWLAPSIPLGGKRLMYAVLKYAKNRRINWVLLISTRATEAKCFYQSIGFRCLVNEGRANDARRFYSGASLLGDWAGDPNNSTELGSLEAEYLTGSLVIYLGNWNKKTFPVSWGGMGDVAKINLPIRSPTGECYMCLD